MRENIAQPQGNSSAELAAILQQVMVMGANDSEPREIQKLINSVQAGSMTPESAITLARSIRDSKQSYH